MVIDCGLQGFDRESEMSGANGGCLCGKVRYSVSTQPSRTTVCHCKFCQRATGGAYLVEPIFDESEFAVTDGEASVYEHVSDGSGKKVVVHFCDNCGTKLYLTFERFLDFVGIYAGTLDDPNWLEVNPENTKHIFLGVALSGTVIPAGVNTFQEHATMLDGTPIEPTVFDKPHVI